MMCPVCAQNDIDSELIFEDASFERGELKMPKTTEEIISTAKDLDKWQKDFTNENKFINVCWWSEEEYKKLEQELIIAKEWISLLGKR